METETEMGMGSKSLMTRRWSAVVVFALCGAVQCIVERVKLSRARGEDPRIKNQGYNESLRVHTTAYTLYIYEDECLE